MDPKQAGSVPTLPFNTPWLLVLSPFPGTDFSGTEDGFLGTEDAEKPAPPFKEFANQ